MSATATQGGHNKGRKADNTTIRIICFVVCLLLVRRYAIAVLAMALWPSVCPSPSQAGIVSKRLNASSSFSGAEATYGYPALCFKGIPVSPKITVLHSGSLSQTLDLEKIHHGPSTDDRRQFITLSVHLCVQHHCAASRCSVSVRGSWDLF